MATNNISSEQHARLKKDIFDILLKNGMKKATMDMVASKLAMSKRTLYEIFENKEDMIKEVIDYSHRLHHNECIRIFQEAPNMMEAFYNMLHYQQEFMKKANPCFFRDMDSKYSKIRPAYDGHNDRWESDMRSVIEIGKEQGVFRNDINYTVLLPMLRIQMESLKRMEEFMPSYITLPEAIDTVIMSFLRSIASPKGMEILEAKAKNYYADNNTESKPE